MSEDDEMEFSEPFDLNDELVEEFLDYCDDAFTSRPTQPTAVMTMETIISI